MCTTLNKFGSAAMVAMLVASVTLLPGQSMAGNNLPAGISTGGSAMGINLAPPAPAIGISAASANSAANVITVANSNASNLPPGVAAAMNEISSQIYSAIRSGNSAAVGVLLQQAAQTLQTALAGWNNLTPAQQEALLAVINAQIALNQTLAAPQ